SQKHEGWTNLNGRYDDGGFTGANIERPALQKLLSDIKEHKVDCVVVYKVDQLSRSLLDFSQLLEFFDQHGVTFVSVTQQFNTNTSMGRLTLHILLSFAQFEREIISERTKDKMAAARKIGQWLGGRPPLGYNVEKDSKKLTVNLQEADLIRKIFQLYLQGNSLLQTANIVNDKGYRTKQATTKNGRSFGGKKFGVTHIQFVLKNVLYLGKVSYGGQIYDGQQDVIIDEETFKKVQEKMTENRVTRKAFKNKDCSGLLTHLLKCKTCKSTMFHTYTLKKGNHKYRYYVCANAQKRGYGTCPNKSINAQRAEDEIMRVLKKTLGENKEKYGDKFRTEIEALLSPVWDTLFFEEKRKILKTLLKEIDCDVAAQKVGLTFHGAGVRLEFDADVKKARSLIRWRKEKEVTKEPKIRTVLVLAHQLQRLMSDGQIQNSQQVSGWLNISQSRLGHILSFLYLSPTIQEEILTGKDKNISLIPEYKIRSLAAEFDWQKQAELWREIKQTIPKN
ncbi:MAG: recombinase family protein, partial [Candidatus Pacebacteria bacterium]|nr:recombinase family protein [Candidatus Paceibacterota bacterium]